LTGTPALVVDSTPESRSDLLELLHRERRAFELNTHIQAHEVQSARQVAESVSARLHAAESTIQELRLRLQSQAETLDRERAQRDEIMRQARHELRSAVISDSLQRERAISSLQQLAGLLQATQLELADASAAEPAPASAQIDWLQWQQRVVDSVADEAAPIAADRFAWHPPPGSSASAQHLTALMHSLNELLITGTEAP
jgi:hypothetical protein